jgi:4-hydroxy-4-methyl-2-oxoglutarate aldolase
VVFPGDIILGDEDSVVVIPREFAAQVCDMAEKKFAEEQQRIKEIHSGVPFRPEIDAYLRKKGVIE